MLSFSVKSILQSLSSIGQVEYRFSDAKIELYKEKTLFAEIVEDNIYIINQQGKTVKYTANIENLKPALLNAYLYANTYK